MEGSGELAAEYAGTPRSEAARLREVLDDVEAALAADASHAAALATLHAQGFTLTSLSFEGTLARLRKERRQPRRSQRLTHLRSPKRTHPFSSRFPLPEPAVHHRFAALG